MDKKIAVFWFRRDLRLEDNTGLYQALHSNLPVLPLFIFDSSITDKLEDKTDARLTFIHRSLSMMREHLLEMGSSLCIKIGTPLQVWKELIEEYSIEQVYTNHDYEPYAIKRDQEIGELLTEKGIGFHSFKDQVIFEKNEVLKDDGKPYVVFTPYSKKWKNRLSDFYLQSYPTENYFSNFLQSNNLPFVSLEQVGFEENTHLEIPSPSISLDQKNLSIMANYHQTRDFPAQRGTTRLGIHLRFGTISIRALAKVALEANEKYLNELIWRDFYQSILWHFPHVEKSAFRPAYNHIPWRNQEEEFERWCIGKTGYPLVDAGMRELNQTGYMHNRVRMVVASFLTKHLLIDWRWGEAYFAKKLLDFDLASNNGGWQWAAGSGVDAQPYFRIFNPTSQLQKFDKNQRYFRQWVQEWNSPQYPKPMVEHKFARERCLEVYKSALK